MKKCFAMLLQSILLLITPNLVIASGFRLAEQSLNGVALNSAYVAGASGADSTYYNPANMGLDERAEIELNGTLILVPGFNFTTENRDNGASALGGIIQSGCAQPGACPAYVDGTADTSMNFAPKAFIKTKAFKPHSFTKITFGASMTTPSGLAMNWGGQGGSFLDDVSIYMIELNPVASISFNDVISIGGGWRAIYSGGAFNNTLYVPYDVPGLSQGTTKVEQKSQAKDWGMGWNAGLSIRPIKSLTIAATYRSSVHFDMKGKLDAIANVNPVIADVIPVDMDADLTLSTDMPAILAVAIAQDFGRLKAEFVYEYTFWSQANIFEFGYANQVFNPDTILGSINVGDMMGAADYGAVAMGRGWKNSSAYRLGLTYTTEKARLMASCAFDETPAPQGRFGIPDANAYMAGIGARYKIWQDKVDVGVGYSIALKDNTRSFIQSKDGLGQLHLITLGAKYIF